jgi:uncharacterized protein (DUF1697 family)
MTSFIALVRGINVGGHKPIAMADLRGLLLTLGFHEPQSLLQSGNLIFKGDSRPAATIERLLEKEAEKHLDIQVDFLVRTAREWAEIIAKNPFPREAASDPSHLAVMCLKDAPTRESLTALKTAIVGRETIHLNGRQLYIIYPDGIGRSRLTHGLIEKTLATRGTARNWNTVLKIASLL